MGRGCDTLLMSCSAVIAGVLTQPSLQIDGCVVKSVPDRGGDACLNERLNPIVTWTYMNWGWEQERSGWCLGYEVRFDFVVE